MVVVAEAKPPPPKTVGGFGDYAVISPHCLRIYLEKSYREALDLLGEIPQILAEIGLEADEFLYHSTLIKAFDRFEMKIRRVLLRLSAQIHDTADHAAMDATFFNRKTASKHYCRRMNYPFKLKTTALVDTKTSCARRSLYDRETARHTDWLVTLPPQRGRDCQLHRRQKLRLAVNTREITQGGRKTADQAP